MAADTDIQHMSRRQHSVARQSESMRRRRGAAVVLERARGERGEPGSERIPSTLAPPPRAEGSDYILQDEIVNARLGDALLRSGGRPPPPLPQRAVLTIPGLVGCLGDRGAVHARGAACGMGGRQRHTAVGVAGAVASASGRLPSHEAQATARFTQRRHVRRRMGRTPLCREEEERDNCGLA